MTDEVGLMLGAVIRSHANHLKVNRDAKIDRKTYPCDIEINYSVKRFGRSRVSKISLSTVKAVNFKIRRITRNAFFEYARLEKLRHPRKLNIDIISDFCRRYELSETGELFEALKKFEYRKRKSQKDE